MAETGTCARPRRNSLVTGEFTLLFIVKRLTDRVDNDEFIGPTLVQDRLENLLERSLLVSSYRHSLASRISVGKDYPRRLRAHGDGSAARG
jgi:hypothetical protein